MTDEKNTRNTTPETAKPEPTLTNPVEQSFAEAERLAEQAEAAAKDEPSPCCGVCQLDEMLVCQGCGRTLQEIADWPFMKSSDRESVVERALARLAARRQSLAEAQRVEAEVAA